MKIVIRHLVFAILSLASATAITIGTAGFSEPAAWIVGGILLFAWSWMALGE